MLLTIPTTFTASTVAKSAEVNANFAAVATAFNTTAVQTDVQKTLSVDLLFTDATYDIGKTGATRPRDGFFSRNVTVGGVLTVSSVFNTAGGVLTGDIGANKDLSMRPGSASGIIAFLDGSGFSRGSFGTTGMLTLLAGLTLTGLGGGTGLVSVDAVDTAGAGFRRLRVPN